MWEVWVWDSGCVGGLCTRLAVSVANLMATTLWPPQNTQHHQKNDHQPRCSPAQSNKLLSRVKPLLHLHSNDPGVLVHMCWQPPLLVPHSSMSVGELRMMSCDVIVTSLTMTHIVMSCVNCNVCDIIGWCHNVTFYNVWHGGGGGVGQAHIHHDVMQSFHCFYSWEEAALHFQCILKSIPHEKAANELLISHYTWLRICIKQLPMFAALQRISATADFSTILKYLASGKKSVEQLRPATPR